ncbi:expressed unknown protein [Seminavis robusta]|uniref:Uncharacterized protein n=1 Tax=Seminavis robusta TaxID=568900 RepID=A0A9N8ET03_9STRA|nr:expressed unknown protein [Seminavis robusta]|eukprot:Sro1600_g285030.1 n/a (275) ;mRNA; f:11023-11847
MMAVVSPHDNLALSPLIDPISSTAERRRPVPFALPKKLGSDRLLLVSQALHETPTYKSISPELQKQRKSLRPLDWSSHSQAKRVHFRAVDQIHEYEKDYTVSDYPDLWFSDTEFAAIFDRDDDDYTVCYAAMDHTKQILQLWGMCSRAASQRWTCMNTSSNQISIEADEDDELPHGTVSAVDTLFQQAPHPHARGLEHRIITGIRNHRQKAVQSFLQHAAACKDADDNQDEKTIICPRYLKFSQTAGQFARALAEGDARVAHTIQQEEEEGNEE